jgi:lysophospholipase L1-like esterase
MLVGLLVLATACAPAGTRDATEPFENELEPARTSEVERSAREGAADLVFVGDSITAQFEKQGQEIWRRFYGNRAALNLGVGWEQTGNVLWRIDQGHFDALQPALVVLQIGTNNSQHGGHDPAEIRAGIQSIVSGLREKMPATQVLLLAIFPRGLTVDDPYRLNNEATNRLLAALDDGENVHYRDINAVFLLEDGRLDAELFASDFLHLSAAGYERWAAAIEPDVRLLLGSEDGEGAP